MIYINRMMKEGKPVVFEFSNADELFKDKTKINFKLDLDSGTLLVETLSNDREYIKKQIEAFLIKKAHQAERQATEALQTQNLINKLLG
jgi:hypothetical protein